jgi:hypothetical protein
MARTLGLGTVLAVDDDDSGTVFTTISLAVSATPPPRRRVRIPGTALADTLATEEAGIEDVSDYVFTHYYEPNETNGNLMTTLFAAKTKVLWQITYASADIEAFEGIVMAIEPQQIVTDQLLTRQITIHRTGAISYT